MVQIQLDKSVCQKKKKYNWTNLLREKLIEVKSTERNLYNYLRTYFSHSNL